MHFDWTVNAGTIISTIGLLIAFATAHISQRERITRIETKVEIMLSGYLKKDH